MCPPEREGNEIYFYDLRRHGAWWAQSRLTPTGTIRIDSTDNLPVVTYAVSAWPDAPIALATASAMVSYGVLIGDRDWIFAGLAAVCSVRSYRLSPAL